jgi:hypothetical protein
MSSRGLVATSTALLGCLLSALALARQPLMDLKLVWKPSKTPSELGKVDVDALKQARVKVQALADRRSVPNPEEVGENREEEDKGVTFDVLTVDSVPAFCTAHLTELLQGMGLQVGDSGPSVVISGEVETFYVIEKGAYDGTVAFKLRAADRAGKVLWTGEVTGTAHGKGRSYKADKYFETLSDAVTDAVVKLVSEPGFRAALAGAK